MEIALPIVSLLFLLLGFCCIFKARQAVIKRGKEIDEEIERLEKHFEKLFPHKPSPAHRDKKEKDAAHE